MPGDHGGGGTEKANKTGYARIMSRPQRKKGVRGPVAC